VTRVAVLRDAALSIGPAQFGVPQAVAPSINTRDAGEMERAIASINRSVSN
jgi:hypothetical protein